jgi:hypothetical protein
MQATSEWTLTSRLKLAISAAQFRRSFQRRNESKYMAKPPGTAKPRGGGAMRSVMILVLVAAICYAQERRDGNFWRGGICPGCDAAATKTLKTVYITGMLDGALLNLPEDFKVLQHVTIGQVMDGMDRFYGEYRNRSIGVSDALVVVAMEIRGDSPEKIAAHIADVRRFAAK